MGFCYCLSVFGTVDRYQARRILSKAQLMNLSYLYNQSAHGH
jgi:hypothetical protein